MRFSVKVVLLTLFFALPSQAGKINPKYNNLQSGVGSQALDVSRQSCSSGGICPNPNGAFIIDPWVFWAKVNGGQRDADGSTYTLSTNVNAVTDFLRSVTTITLGTSSTLWSQILTVPTAQGVNFCRGSVDFEACSGTATSSGTCTVTVSTGSPDVFVAYNVATNSYVPLDVSSYNGCVTTTNQSVTVNSGIPYAFTTGDTLQRWSTDGLHPWTYYHRWLADLVLNASEEWAFYPAVNPISNGSADTTCVGGGAGWTASAGGTLGSNGQDTTAASTTHRPARGARNCYLASRAATTDALDTASFTVKPNETWVTKGFARINNGNVASHNLTFQIVDTSATLARSDSSLTNIVDSANTATVTTALPHNLKTGDTVYVEGATVDTDLNSGVSGVTVTVTGATTFTFTSASVTDTTYTDAGLKIEKVLPTTDVEAWQILPSYPILLTAETTTSANECADYCYIVLKFKAGPAQTSAKVRFISSTGTDNLVADEWTAFPAITQNLTLNPLIRDGRVTFRIESDSRANDPTDTADFPYNFDYRAPLIRPNLKFTSPLAANISAVGGRKVQDIVNASYSSIRSSVSDYTLLYLGINDTVADRTAAQLSSDILSTIREIRMSGSIPIVMLDPPYASNVDSGSWTTECNSTYCALSTSDMISILVNAPGPY